MAQDATGGIWLTGYTFSKNFPTTRGAFQTSLGGDVGGFVLRFDPSRPRDQVITYSSYFGWSRAEVIYGVAPLPGGKVALAGYTMSPDYPLIVASWDVVPKIRLTEAFIAVLDPSIPGSDALTYSALFGGALIDAATTMVVDPIGNLYITGITTSSYLPVTDGSYKPTPAGTTSSFVMKVNPAP
jgi:hypothetical protein